MKVMFCVKNEYGYVQYDQNTKSVQVIHRDENIVKLVKAYLTKEKFFEVPSGEGLGHRRIQAVPVESSHAMTAALCEMRFNIGVSIDWGHPETVLPRIAKTDERK